MTCSEGVSIDGGSHSIYIDGYDLLDYLSGKIDKSPRHEFFYVNYDGEVVAMRSDDWNAVYLENRSG